MPEMRVGDYVIVGDKIYIWIKINDVWNMLDSKPHIFIGDKIYTGGMFYNSDLTNPNRRNLFDDLKTFNEERKHDNA